MPFPVDISGAQRVGRRDYQEDTFSVYDEVVLSASARCTLVVLQFIVFAAILLVAGCGASDEQPPIILDESGWKTVETYTGNINNRLVTPSDTTPGITSSNGPLIRIGHPNPGQVDGKQFKISVSITPNQDTNALVNLTTLTIKARKRVFGKLREKDITDEVKTLLRKERCTSGDFCESLSVDRTVKLGYGRGEYMFSIHVSDQTDRMTVSAFTITRT